MTGKNTAKLRVGVMRSWMVEKHSNVPHMRSTPEQKQVTTSTGTLRVCMVTRLHTMRPAQTHWRIRREVKRNFRRNRMGNTIEMPRNEASPAMRMSSCINAVSPTISPMDER